jgi:hypothetical protein
MVSDTSPVSDTAGRGALCGPVSPCGRRLAILVAGAVLVFTAGGRVPAADAGLRAAACPAARAGPASAKRTLGVLRAGKDVWGNRLLALPGGPSYAAARRYLKPLWYARGRGGKPLTASGAYYLPFAQPDGPRGAGSVALHVADGSQIV